MGRSRTIRTKIIGLLLVPLASMVVLWGVITAVTAGESLELRQYTTLWTNLRHPAHKLGNELQRERLASVKFLNAGKTATDRSAIAQQRARSDRVREEFRKLSGASRDTSEAIRTQVDVVYTQLSRLDSIRGEIDAGLSDRLHTVEAYNAAIDALFGLHRRVGLIDDIPIYEQSRLVIDLGYAEELLTREQAIAIGPTTPAERRLFAQLVGNRRFLIDHALGELDPTLREIQVSIITSPVYQRLRLMEDQIIAGGAPRGWLATTEALSKSFSAAQLKASIMLSARSEPVADAVLVRALILAGTCLLLIIVSIVFTLRMGNRLSKELFTLREAALEVSRERLPEVVAKLRKGETVEVPELSVASTTAEIGDVGQAFSTVQQTAVEAAVGQAQLRHGVSHVFRNLARRNQACCTASASAGGHAAQGHRPGRLEDLFRLDHLTTRMRRHAEGLIILSGAAPGRGWRRPVPLMDVVRGAIGEVEDYHRVIVEPMPTQRAERARGRRRDPPDRRAHRERHRLLPAAHHGHGARRGGGQRLRRHVEDRGLGMSAGGTAPTSTGGWPARRSSTWPTATSSAFSWWPGWPPGMASGDVARFTIWRDHRHRADPGRACDRSPGRAGGTHQAAGTPHAGGAR